MPLLQFWLKQSIAMVMLFPSEMSKVEYVMILTLESSQFKEHFISNSYQRILHNIEQVVYLWIEINSQKAEMKTANNYIRQIWLIHNDFAFGFV